MISTTADALPRLMQCSGNPQMPPSYPVESLPSQVREEGTAAHWLAAKIFAQDEFIDTSELVDRKTPNGVYVSPEMAEHVDDYLTVIGKRKPYDWSEMECETSWFTIRGRADHIGFAAGVLYVDDLKYGFVAEEPENDWTLISHAIGWCESRQYVPGEICFVIHQPRIWNVRGTVREWRISYTDLMVLRDQIAETLASEDRTLRTGRECFRCHAHATCPAATQTMFKALETSDFVHSEELPGDVISNLLDIATQAQTVLKRKIEALEELTEYRLRQGEPMGNYTLEPQFGRERWNDGITAEILQIVTGKDLRKPQLLTPKQAAKIVAPELVKSFSTTPSNGFKLVRETPDAKAKRLFNNGAK